MNHDFLVPELTGPSSSWGRIRRDSMMMQESSGKGIGVARKAGNVNQGAVQRVFLLRARPGQDIGGRDRRIPKSNHAWNRTKGKLWPPKLCHNS